MTEWRDPLRDGLRIAIEGVSDPDEIVEVVMGVLNRANVVSYSDSPVRILSNLGRVWMDLACHPGSTGREVAVRVGMSETQVMKHITKLWNNSLLEKKQKQNRFGYFLDLKTLLSNGDIHTVLKAVINASKPSQDQADEQPDISA